MRRQALLLALALATLAHLACGENGDEPPAAAKAAPASESAVPAKSGADDHSGHDHEDESSSKRSRGRPLPSFEGWTLADEQIRIADLIGKRLMLYFFNPEVADAPTLTRAVTSVAAERNANNFQVVGVSVGSNRRTTNDFVKEHGIDFPVIDDASGAITRQLGLRMPLAILGADGEGYLNFGLAQFAFEGPDPAAPIEAQLRQALRLPANDATTKDTDPSLGTHPAAPDFTSEILDGKGATFELAKQRGRPVVLIFFLHTCPHCHDALGFLKESLAKIPEDKRPVLVGVEITGKTYAVRQGLKELDLDFFPVLFDDDQSIRTAYGVFGGVPETFLIDAQGRIREHLSGWDEERDPALMRMRLAKTSGAAIPMLLRSKGYSGSEACGVCHESEHETWLFTTHASAFDTLVKHGADNDEECIGCHVVGFGKPGGFVDSAGTGDLEDVGCESCHGRGGPHLSPQFVTGADYTNACAGCHDAKHSLGFEYASFLPKVSHAANLHLTKLPLAEKRKRLEALGSSAPRDVLPTTASHVGSEACQSCHAGEYATWAANPHASAVKTLAAKGEQANADCLACHTTGFGRDGGFPSGAAVDAHADLARVGCESCHGPGGDHVAEGAKRIGTIVSLGDKCDSCVILQICGSCHDDANDPGFEFEVLDKIEALRHGTIEAGTGKPLEGRSSAGHRHERPEDLAARAFELLDERG